MEHFRGCEPFKLSLYDGTNMLDMRVNITTHWIFIPGLRPIDFASDFLNELILSLLEQYHFRVISIGPDNSPHYANYVTLFLRFEQDHTAVGELVSAASKEMDSHKIIHQREQLMSKSSSKLWRD